MKHKEKSALVRETLDAMRAKLNKTPEHLKHLLPGEGLLDSGAILIDLFSRLRFDRWHVWRCRPAQAETSVVFCCWAF